MRLLPIVSIFLTVLTVSCNKKKEIGPEPAAEQSQAAQPRAYDTIYPGSYFPAYPGSTWKYLDRNNNIFSIETDPVYKLDHYVIAGTGFKSDTVYVPFYETQGVWGYELHNGGASASQFGYPFINVLFENSAIGAGWEISRYKTGVAISRRVIARDTAISISGTTYFPTMVTEEYVSAGVSNYIWTFRRYYTKDIGLVMETMNNPPDSSIVTTKALVSYTINK